MKSSERCMCVYVFVCVTKYFGMEIWLKSLSRQKKFSYMGPI